MKRIKWFVVLTIILIFVLLGCENKPPYDPSILYFNDNILGKNIYDFTNPLTKDGFIFYNNKKKMFDGGDLKSHPFDSLFVNTRNNIITSAVYSSNTHLLSKETFFNTIKILDSSITSSDIEYSCSRPSGADGSTTEYSFTKIYKNYKIEVVYLSGYRYVYIGAGHFTHLYIFLRSL